MAIGGVRLATNVARTTKEGASVHGGGRGPTRSITLYPDLETPFRRANDSMVKAGHDWYRAVMAAGDAIRGYGKVKSENASEKAANSMMNEYGGAAGLSGSGSGGGFMDTMFSWWGGS